MAVSTSGLVFKQFAVNLDNNRKYYTSSRVGILSVLFSLVEKQQIHRMKRIMNESVV